MEQRSPKQEWEEELLDPGKPPHCRMAFDYPDKIHILPAARIIRSMLYQSASQSFNAFILPISVGGGRVLFPFPRWETEACSDSHRTSLAEERLELRSPKF